MHASRTTSWHPLTLWAFALCFPAEPGAVAQHAEAACRSRTEPASSASALLPESIYAPGAAALVKGFTCRPACCLLLQVPECQAQVHRTLERASQDIRFTFQLAEDCTEDRKKLCPDAQPVCQAAAKSNRPSTAILACCCATESWTQPAQAFQPQTTFCSCFPFPRTFMCVMPMLPSATCLECGDCRLGGC